MNKVKVFLLVNLLYLFIHQITANGIDLMSVPGPEYSESSILCLAQFVQKYFHAERPVHGSLVIINTQETIQFHDQFIKSLNMKTNYELGIMVKDVRKKHVIPIHIIRSRIKAKNYLVVFNDTSEVIGAIQQWLQFYLLK